MSRRGCVDGTGAPQQGVGLDWVQRLAIGTANFQPLDGVTDEGGLLVLAEAPVWWAYMCRSSTSPHAGALRAVGVRASLPFVAYVPTAARQRRVELGDDIVVCDEHDPSLRHSAGEDGLSNGMRTFTRITLLALAAGASVLGVQCWGLSGEARPLVPSRTEDAEGPEAVGTLAPGAIDRGSGARERIAATVTEQVASPLDLPSAESEASAPFLTVRVVDDRGAPQVGVRLQWVLRMGLGNARRMPVEGETDQEGLLVIAEAPSWPRVVSGVSTTDLVRAVGVRPALPYDAYEPSDADDVPGAVWRDQDAPPGTVLEIVLPPTGAIQFDWERSVARTAWL